MTTLSAITAALEAAAKACEQQKQDFLSPQYATGQPLSSLMERFACDECARAIRAIDAKAIEAREGGDGTAPSRSDESAGRQASPHPHSE